METINLNDEVTRIIEEIKQLKVVTYDEVLQKGNEQPLLDCIEIDTGEFVYNSGQGVFTMQDLNADYITRCNSWLLMSYIESILRRKTILKLFIQEMKYAEAYLQVTPLPYGYSSLFEAITNYLDIDLDEETDYKNDDNWIKIYDFLDKYREKTDDELIDIFKFLDDCMIDLIDWYDEEIINPTNEEIIKATRFALRKMYNKIKCVMHYRYESDFRRFVTKVLRETVGGDV